MGQLRIIPMTEFDADPFDSRLNSESDEDRFADWANLLFEQALLAEGGQLDDPASFVRRLNGLLAMLPGFFASNRITRLRRNGNTAILFHGSRREPVLAQTRNSVEGVFAARAAIHVST